MTLRIRVTRLVMRPAHIVLALIVFVSTRSIPAQSPGPALLRQLYGDVAIEVLPGEASAIRIAAADSTRQVMVTMNASDVLRWADSAKRVLSERLRGTERRGQWQAVLEEPGTNSGSIVLSRAIDRADTIIALLVADGDFERIHATLDPEDAAAFVAALRRSAHQVLGAARPRRPPIRR